MDQLHLLTLTTVVPVRSADLLPYRQPGDSRPALQVYVLSLPGGRQRQGVTLGHTERSYGHFLLRSSGRDGGLVRFFVPRNPGVELSFRDDRRHDGRSRAEPDAAEPAGAGPVRDKQQLRLALQAQACMPLRLTGEVLVELGLVTARQLADVLDGQTEDPGVPVGERLVAAGCLSAEDLRAALRFKLAYPLVDLRRFPLESALLKRLPAVLARRWQVLPVMRVEQGVVVAMADPDDQRVLDELRVLFQAPVLPVLPWGEVIDLLVAAAYARHRLGPC